MKRVGTKPLATAGLLATTALALAGGSGLNVAVVVNQHSPDSVQLGNYYCERRQVPPENFLRISWSGSNIQWSKADFESHLLNPLTEMLASRGLSGQLDTVVLSMDIPYRVADTSPTNSGRNSTTSALFYGFHPEEDLNLSGIPDSCSLPEASTNPYAGSELPFRSVTNGNAWLAFMITATNLASAMAIVDRGVASDGSFPTQRVFLTKSTDPARNVRYWFFDDAIMDSRVLGRMELIRTNAESSTSQGRQLGCQTGRQVFSLTPNLFVPGAMADNLTSNGGELFENSGHTGVTNFLMAGATASYGTVVEPCNWPQKFPWPHIYFYQARGFSIAECYYQGLANPFQGILVGEPLAAPFAVNADAAWLDLPDAVVLSGRTNLSLRIIAPEATRPVQQVDLFLDGKFLRTLTNLPPQAGDVLTVSIAGHSISYPVPTNATLATVASALADEINLPAITNITRVQAAARGDRLELQSSELGRLGEAVELLAYCTNSHTDPPTTFLAAARPHFLDTSAFGLRSFSVTNTVETNSYLQLLVQKTNGSAVTVAVTNSPGNTDTAALVQALVSAINADTTLRQPDGLVAEDFVRYNLQPGAEFNLRSRSVGWPESQLQATLSASTNLGITPNEPRRLDENLTDLRPRNHLYLTAGTTNLPVTFTLDTTTLADGFHELTAVAYEGSHVRTQTRIAQSVRITNSPLAATFTPPPDGSNALVTTTLRFTVTANTNAIARIELFSTGGRLAEATDQSAVTFDVAGTNLQAGLHPFYALVTRTDGQRYRTETRWLRLEAPFSLSITGLPPVLSWPATVGRSYEVLDGSNPAAPFQYRTTLAATNTPARWTETEATATERFYRVRLVP